MAKTFISRLYLNTHQGIAADFIHSLGPFRFFITLTFNHRVTDEEGIEHASTFVRRLLKQIFGRYKWRNEPPLQGIAVLERARVERRGPRDRGRCHFHFLIKNHQSLQQHPIKALKTIKVAVEHAALGLNLSSNKKLTSKSGFDATLVLSDGIFEYLTKEARYRRWHKEERLFFLDKHGLVSFVVPQTELVSDVHC